MKKIMLMLGLLGLIGVSPVKAEDVKYTDDNKSFIIDKPKEATLIYINNEWIEEIATGQEAERFVQLIRNQMDIDVYVEKILDNIDYDKAQVEAKEELKASDFEEIQKILHQEEVPFKTMTEYDDSLQIGESKLSQKGKEGQFTVTGIYKVNTETGEAELIDEIHDLIPPVNEVIVHGSKIPKNDLSVNLEYQSDYEILSKGINEHSLVEGIDFGYQTEYFPGPVNPKDQLYRISNSIPQYDGFESYGFNNRLYITESITRTGKLFSQLKVGETILLEGKTYQVKAIEFPTTAQRDRFIPSFNNITGQRGYYSDGNITNYGNSNVLEHHLDYLISTVYNSPTSRLIQVCMDSRMVPQSQWSSHGDRYTNKILVLDLVDSSIPSGVGNVYPFIGWNYVSPVYDDIEYW